MSTSPTTIAALDRARVKAYIRLLPILFLSYVIAYVDRVNVSLATIEMSKDLPAFDNEVVGFGAGVFFIGYFILEIPGTLLVEKWSATKVDLPDHDLMGDRGGIDCLRENSVSVLQRAVSARTGGSRVLSRSDCLLDPLVPRSGSLTCSLVVLRRHARCANPQPQALLLPAPDRHHGDVRQRDGTTPHGLGTTRLAVDVHRLGHSSGDSWALLCCISCPIGPKTHPGCSPTSARPWSTDSTRDKEMQPERHRRHLNLGETLVHAFQHPKVLLLAAAYFFVVTASYGVEIFLPKILEKWYELPLSKLTWMVLIPPIGGLIGQILVGWSSDRTGERRLHASLPIYLGAVALGATLLIPISLPLQWRLLVAVALFAVALLGLKSYMPAFWALPSLFLTEAAAAGSIGLINSVGNLGGFVGPSLLGNIESQTHSFMPGLCTYASR